MNYKNETDMKATEIKMQIVKNLGNYESVRLEATYTLDDNDDIEQSFKSARKQLEKSFITAYEGIVRKYGTAMRETGAEISDDEMNKAFDEPIELGTFDTKKLRLSDKQFKRVLTAFNAGAVTLESIEQDFELTDYQRKILNGLLQ